MPKAKASKASFSTRLKLYLTYLVVVITFWVPFLLAFLAFVSRSTTINSFAERYVMGLTNYTERLEKQVYGFSLTKTKK